MYCCPFPSFLGCSGYWDGCFFATLNFHHAATAQFPTSSLLQLDPVEELLSQKGIEKPLSALNGILLVTNSPNNLETVGHMEMEHSLSRQRGLGGLS